MNEIEHISENLDNCYGLQRQLLGGARDWTEYSELGCSLKYDWDIAKRVCTPSEYTRKDEGYSRPHKYETWIGIQAKALFQAAKLINKTIKEVK